MVRDLRFVAGARAARMSQAAARDHRESPVPAFSLVEGGLLFRALVRTGLVRPGMGRVPLRLLVVPALAWVPLLLLASIDGHALAGVRVPLLLDLEAGTRFLLAMPLLLYAEVVVHHRLREVIEDFGNRDVIPPRAEPAFRRALASAMRARDAWWVEASLALLVLVLGPWVWRHGLVLQADTWYATIEGGKAVLTPAGWWLIHVSAPMFQFLWLRWYYRIAIWWRLMWQVSRLPLDLQATHPDRAGGLGFVGDSLGAFTATLLAQAVVVSGIIASRIMLGEGSALDYRPHVLVMIVLLLAVVTVPMLFFHGRLKAVHRAGLRAFEALAATYARMFERKWLESRPAAQEPLLGSADLQSLADLAASNEAVRAMRELPFAPRALVELAAMVAVPFLPLVLTVIPLAELVKELLGMLL